MLGKRVAVAADLQLTIRQRSGAVPDSGSEMGAEAFRQVRSDTVQEADRGVCDLRRRP
jgi:hypothetical protein